MARFIHLFSGGLDSTTLLYSLLRQEHKVECITIEYGQTHRKEINVAKEFCTDLGVPHHLLKMPLIYKNCALVGGSSLGDSETEIVPNRNMIFISCAAAFALENGFTAVSWAANKDDEKIFPDCRYESFLKPLNTVLRACHTRRMEVHAPFLMGGQTKRQVVELALELGVPIERTWSCYLGRKEPCGECGACKLRTAALDSITSTNGQ